MLTRPNKTPGIGTEALRRELSRLPVPLQAKQRANSLQEVCKPHRQHGYRESHSSLHREIRAAVFASNVLRRRLRGLPLQAGSIKVAHRISQESKEGTGRPERCILISQTSCSPRQGDHESAGSSSPFGGELHPSSQRFRPGRTAQQARRFPGPEASVEFRARQAPARTA